MTDASGVDTDIDDAVIVIEPEDSSQATITIRRSELDEPDSNPKKEDRDRGDEMDVDRSLGRRFTQMNIIDLTKD